MLTTHPNSQNCHQKIVDCFPPNSASTLRGSYARNWGRWLDQGAQSGFLLLTCKYPRKMAAVTCRCAFRLRSLAQDVCRALGLRHFTYTFPHKMALVTCPCAFGLSKPRTKCGSRCIILNIITFLLLLLNIIILNILIFVPFDIIIRNLIILNIIGRNIILLLSPLPQHYRTCKSLTHTHTHCLGSLAGAIFWKQVLVASELFLPQTPEHSSCFSFQRQSFPWNLWDILGLWYR